MEINSQLAASSWRKFNFIEDTLRKTSIDLFGYDGKYTFAQFPIIKFFFEQPDPPPQAKDLSSITGMSSGAISQAINLYVSEGILERLQWNPDHRMVQIKMTEKGLALRNAALQHFDNILNEFKQTYNIPPEKIAIAHNVVLKLAMSRTGCEHLKAEQTSDLYTPYSCTRELTCKMGFSNVPDWLLIMHFADNLRIPIVVYHYGTNGRMTLGKLRILNYLFILEHFKRYPKVKDLADTFRLTSGSISQTLRVLVADGMIERIQEAKDQRVVNVHLTEKGLSIRKRCAGMFTKYMVNFFETLQPEEVDVICEMLTLSVNFLRSRPEGVPKGY